MSISLPNHPNVESRPLEFLIPNPRNPRTHTARQIGQIAASIERFGFLVPIILDDANNIVAGHGRLAASKQLGLTEVPKARQSAGSVISG